MKATGIVTCGVTLYWCSLRTCIIDSPSGNLTGFAHIVLGHQDVVQQTDRHYVT